MNARLDENGGLVWTPQAFDSGTTQSFKISARLGGDKVEQAFSVRVPKANFQKVNVSDTGLKGNKVVSVDSPLSAIQGTSVLVPEGAIEGQTKTLTIAEVENAAPITGVTGGKVVQLGPSGTVFSEPVSVTLPRHLIRWSRFPRGRLLRKPSRWGTTGLSPAG